MTKKNFALTIEDIIGAVSNYITDKKELDNIRSAYDYALEKHFGQKRLTGEDYIEHPLNVAYILTEINADYQTLCAALLHDVMEDCDVDSGEIKTLFGEDIYVLVDGVTKINQLNFSGDTEAIIANHRKILVGLSKDVRVIIIKLADRLHNMRTLWVLPEEKQKEKAKETLDILTPIAHRLGIFKIKSELEDLSLRYYKPDVYFSIVERLNQTKVERDKIVADMVSKVSSLLDSQNIKYEIKGRSKSIYSIYKKLDKGKKFSDIYDLLALRVLVNSVSDCYQALGLIHSIYHPLPKRFKDYIAMPKTNMYQSLHTTVIGLEGYFFEIQIRTHEMDKIAEKGIAAHWSYKEHGSKVSASMQNTMEQKLQFFRSIIELRDDEESDKQFVDSVKEEVFNHTIYVFTPGGDVIELPNGATPIDFAYRIHSDVGDKMVGALVNGNIVPIDYKLQSNDVVKINTNNNSLGPSREWLNIVYTTQAKNKIRAFFNKIDKDDYLKKGEEIIAKELRKRKVSVNDFYLDENIDKILNELKLPNLDELHIALGNNKIAIGQVMNIVYNDTATKQEIMLEKAKNNVVKPKINKNDIVVLGIDDIKVNIASCCMPIPGDKIVGYITRGYGINIHRCNCPNVFEFNERLIDVHWNNSIINKYSASILVSADNDTDILLNIITKANNTEVKIQSINSLNAKEYFMYEIKLLVADTEKLENFMNEIRTIPHIIKVERSMK
ncbi:MAG: bifunctional (p)ppGpp synthetase/guanosine-3',5'-bis(diphosphate) 3'-pyrophosphohydrolase [Bacilli bacterium]|nr:bifunctional (p)ppGpp synthetase/guanosine-3',5'-bis(diphosphate) 3'-pyrophosphohydrolase [Bacilli bacterium]